MTGLTDIRRGIGALALALCCLQHGSALAQTPPRQPTPLFQRLAEPTQDDAWPPAAAAGYSTFQPPQNAQPVPTRTPNAIQLAQAVSGDSDDHWQFAPVGLLYKSYLAGEKEARISSVWMSDSRKGLLWENALGGKVGIVRYGNEDILHPQGWQFDLEGAALPRVIPQDPSSPLEAVDFRIGLLSTWRNGNTAYKAGYYHLSSHVGDEYLIANPGFVRINYVRDSAIMGITQYFLEDYSVYAEMAYALGAEDGAKPLEFQYGFQYSPMVTGLPGAPFAAINGHTRQDFGWETSLTVQGGWQWRSAKTNRTFRVGMQYYRGPSMQWELANVKENMLGAGMWFDY